MFSALFLLSEGVGAYCYPLSPFLCILDAFPRASRTGAFLLCLPGRLIGRARGVRYCRKCLVCRPVIAYTIQHEHLCLPLGRLLAAMRELRYPFMAFDANGL